MSRGPAADGGGGRGIGSGRILGEVLQFVGVVFEVVELPLSIDVIDVLPPLGPDRAVRRDPPPTCSIRKPDRHRGDRSLSSGTMLRPSGSFSLTPARSANVGARSMFSTMRRSSRARPRIASYRTTMGTRMLSSYGASLPRRRCSPNWIPLSDVKTNSVSWISPDARKVRTMRCTASSTAPRLSSCPRRNSSNRSSRLEEISGIAWTHAGLSSMCPPRRSSGTVRPKRAQ